MLYSLDLFGIAVFAITGCLRVREKQLDLLGMLVIAVVTALGGGTTRDVLLGIHPIFWIRDMNYVWVALAAAIFTFIAARWLPFPNRVLLIADALGLSVAAILGVQTSLNNGAPLPIAVMMGMVSGTAGGVIRDILSNEIPLIFGSELYATTALTGAVLFVVVKQLASVSDLATFAGIATVLILRLTAIRFKIMLPAFRAQEPQ
jgi:uncharacterized membrane protein YeiH